jgi:hypothetical protein
MKIWHGSLIKDIVIANVIVFLPFLIYFHLLFESTQGNIILWGIDIPNRFTSQEQFIWNIMLKLVPICLLSLWYITNRNKWGNYILIPIVLYSDSLIRYTLFPFSYPDLLALIFSLFNNLIFITTLIIIRKYYQKKFVEEIKSVKISNLLYSESKKNYIRFKDFIDRIKRKAVEENNVKYYQNLFVLRKNIEANITKSRLNYTYSITSRAIHSLIVALFILMPIFFNLHRIVPENIRYLDLGLIYIHNYGFPSIDIMFWLFFIKSTFLIALGIWFITCKYWWKYAILSPIILVSYQIWEMFQEVQFIDAWGNLRAFPFVLCILLVLFMLSNYVKYEFKVSELHKSISLELEELIGGMADMEHIEKMKERLNALKASPGKGRGASDSHLDSLIKLREELIRDLEVH